MKRHPIIFSGSMVQSIIDGRKSQTRRVVFPHNSSESDQYELRLADDGVVEIMVPDPTGRTDNVWTAVPKGFESSYRCPFGKVGDHLWVRETFLLTVDDASFQNEYETVEEAFKAEGIKSDDWIYYRADWLEENPDFDSDPVVWKSPIYMPSWASRISLEITEVRIQRLNDISDDDVTAEGVRCERNRVGFEIGTLPWNGDNSLYWEDCQAEGWTQNAQEAYRSLWDSINEKKHPSSANPWVWAISFRKVDGAQK